MKTIILIVLAVFFVAMQAFSDWDKPQPIVTIGNVDVYLIKVAGKQFVLAKFSTGVSITAY